MLQMSTGVGCGKACSRAWQAKSKFDAACASNIADSNSSKNRSQQPHIVQRDSPPHFVACTIRKKKEGRSTFKDAKPRGPKGDPYPKVPSEGNRLLKTVFTAAINKILIKWGGIDAP